MDFLLSRHSPMLPQPLFPFPLSLLRKGSLPSIRFISPSLLSHTYGLSVCPSGSLEATVSLSPGLSEFKVIEPNTALRDEVWGVSLEIPWAYTSGLTRHKEVQSHKMPTPKFG